MAKGGESPKRYPGFTLESGWKAVWLKNGWALAPTYPENFVLIDPRSDHQKALCWRIRKELRGSSAVVHEALKKNNLLEGDTREVLL